MKASSIRKMLWAWCMLPMFSVYAAPSIPSLITQLHTLPKAERLQAASAFFLDKPYVLHPLGEGKIGRYDQYPLFRTDAFDCLTYIETVIALSLASNFSTFQTILQHVRYHEGRIDFVERNHFMSLDWNVHNQAQGFVRDVTQSVHDGDGKSIAVMATTLIDKAAWYQHFTLPAVRVKGLTKIQRMTRLTELKAAGKQFKPEVARIYYIPLTALFNTIGQPNDAIFSQIPNGTLIEVVRPNWDLVKTIGTHLNVSHEGFAFWKNGVLVFRNASALQNKVSDIPLTTYLQSYLDSPTIKGIALFSVI